MLRRKVSTPIILNGGAEWALAFLVRWVVLRMMLGFYYITDSFVAQPQSRSLGNSRHVDNSKAKNIQCKWQVFCILCVIFTISVANHTCLQR